MMIVSIRAGDGRTCPENYQPLYGQLTGRLSAALRLVPGNFSIIHGESSEQEHFDHSSVVLGNLAKAHLRLTPMEHLGQGVRKDFLAGHDGFRPEGRMSWRWLIRMTRQAWRY